MATIADVAQLAGVSKATASRAFGRPEMVSAATVARVMEAAAKLDFVPNRVARLLAGGRAGIVAIVVPTLENTFFTPIIAGAQERLDVDGVQLAVVAQALERPSDLAAFTRLARRVDGLILVAPRGSDDLVVEASALVPAVLVDREVEGVGSVVADTATAFGELVDGLLSEGHERIVYVGGPAGSWQDRQRSRSVADAAARRGATVHAIGPYDSTFGAGYAAGQAVQALDATAVVPYATSVGLGIQHFYLAAGATPPLVSSERAVAQALGLVGVPLIDVDGVALGRTATELLVQRIADEGGDDTVTTRVRHPVAVDWGRAASAPLVPSNGA